MQLSVDRRARKKHAVRAALETVALELFLEKGFDQTTIDEIATTADFSRSTFFRHFGSKEAVLFGAFEEQGEAMARLLLERPSSEGPLRAFEEAFVGLARITTTSAEDRAIADTRSKLLSKDPDLTARARELGLGWQSRMAEILAEREGLSGPSAAHLLVAAIGTAVGERVGARWSGSHDAERTEALIRAEFQLLRDVVQGP